MEKFQIVFILLCARYHNTPHITCMASGPHASLAVPTLPYFLLLGVALVRMVTNSIHH